MSPQSVTVAAGLIVAGTTAAAQLADKRAPKLRVAFGGLFVSVALSALAGVDAELAARLAWVVIVTAVLTNGIAALSGVTRLLGK